MVRSRRASFICIKALSWRLTALVWSSRFLHIIFELFMHVSLRSWRCWTIWLSDVVDEDEEADEVDEVDGVGEWALSVGEWCSTSSINGVGGSFKISVRIFSVVLTTVLCGVLGSVSMSSSSRPLGKIAFTALDNKSGVKHLFLLSGPCQCRADSSIDKATMSRSVTW